MRKKTVAVIFTVATLMLLVPGNRSDALPTHETVYTQWYNCIISPMPTSPVGEWTEGCRGEWYGWGWEPGHSCTYTVVSQGEPCTSGGGGGNP